MKQYNLLISLNIDLCVCFQNMQRDVFVGIHEAFSATYKYPIAGLRKIICLIASVVSKIFIFLWGIIFT